jgi:hypothetical protein
MNRSLRAVFLWIYMFPPMKKPAPEMQARDHMVFVEEFINSPLSIWAAAAVFLIRGFEIKICFLGMKLASWP